MDLNSLVHRLLSELETNEHYSQHTGLAISIASKDAVLSQFTSGNTRGKTGRPINNKTLFPICSLTKSITATLIMILQEEGVLDIDSPLNDLGNVFPLKSADVSNTVCIRDILQHKTGIPTNDFMWLFSGYNNYKIYKSIKYLNTIPCGFRKVFAYNNLTYACLKPILENITMKKFEDLVREKVLITLDMDSTFFDADFKKNDNFACPSSKDSLLEYKNMAHISPAGGLISNLEDMTKWLRFNLNKGQTQSGNILISPYSFNQLISNGIMVGEPLPMFLQDWDWIGQNCSYGMGYFIGKKNHHKCLCHPGLAQGYSVGMAYLPELGIGIIVMSNANMSPLPPIIINNIFSIILGGDLSIPAQNIPESNDQKKEISKKLYSKYLINKSILKGTYRNKSYGELTITSLGKKLVIIYNNHQWLLEMVSPKEGKFFVSAFDLEIPITLRFDQEKKVIEIPLSMDPRADPSIFKKILSN